MRRLVQALNSLSEGEEDGRQQLVEEENEGNGAKRRKKGSGRTVVVNYDHLSTNFCLLYYLADLPFFTAMAVFLIVS